MSLSLTEPPSSAPLPALDRVATRRLWISRLRPALGDAARLHATAADTLETMQPWFPWANPFGGQKQFQEDGLGALEGFLAFVDQEWEARKQFHYGIFLRGQPGLDEGDADAGVSEEQLRQCTLVGSICVAEIDWSVPRCELSFWLHRAHVGFGFASEAARAITTMAIDVLAVARVEIRTSSRNSRSAALAQRLGFQLDGILRSNCREPAEGKLDSTMVFSLAWPERPKDGVDAEPSALEASAVQAAV